MKIIQQPTVEDDAFVFTFFVNVQPIL